MHAWVGSMRDWKNWNKAETAIIEAASEKGHEGKWLFSLDMPSFIAFITYADNRALREKIWRGNVRKALEDEYDNQDNVKKIVSLRHERARLLGYDTHAAFVLERRMAKDTKTVMLLEMGADLQQRYLSHSQEFSINFLLTSFNFKIFDYI